MTLSNQVLFTFLIFLIFETKLACSAMNSFVMKDVGEVCFLVHFVPSSTFFNI